MRKGCGCLGIGLIAALIFVVVVSMQAATAPRPATVTHQVEIVGQPSALGSIRVGQPTQLVVTVRNVGETTPERIGLQIQGALFDGMILHSVVPGGASDSNSGGSRTLRWPGIGPGAEQTLTLNLVGKTAGEYRYTVAVVADRTIATETSGRVVVLP